MDSISSFKSVKSHNIDIEANTKHSFMVLPNFFIVGAAKAGTTSLYAMLKQHPQIYMSPVKEPNFFALEGDSLDYAAGTTSAGYLDKCITDLEAYHKQFQSVKAETAIGEASPIYLYHPKAPERIQNYIPDAKLIVILRDPVERAYSNFLHHVREGLETFPDFEQALRAEEKRIHENWWWGFYYVKAGFYHDQLQRYIERFDASQMKVYLYEDLKQNPKEMLRSLFEFLGVDPLFTLNVDKKHNIGGLPRNQLWWNFLSQPNPIKAPFKRLLPPKFRRRLVLNLKDKMLVKPDLSPELRSHLIQVYRSDIHRLQELLQRDLSTWLEV